jgi:hypothetical protein
MKTRLYISLAFACILSFSCQKAKKSEDEALSDFAKNVLVAGKAKDSSMLVNKLSMSTVAEGKAFIAQLKKSNPDLTFTDCKENPKDEELRKEMEVNAHLFIDSYADIFDGQLSSIVRAQDPVLKGANVCSMIIWAKHKDGKFRGIKIDNVWQKDDGTFEVLTWVQLSGYDASKNIQKKMAVLVRDTADECDYPEIIQYKSVFIN